ncbi:MAG: DUF72 domain-containing protein [Candidatus Thorarchaeota archaeon]|nr:DUF72 domain-containing protein [Candidatus Thorarchaeota archaeon]
MEQVRAGLFIGTSGWSYATDWTGVFYESKANMLEQYFTYFDTSEINSTFYALPRPEFVSHLAELRDQRKFFTAKLPKKVTHDCRLNTDGEGGQTLQRFFEILSPLVNKIAALLIQLPPWDIDEMSDLETFLSALDSRFRYAIEFRHESWLKEPVFSLLERYHVSSVIVDEPKLPITLRLTTDFAYIRWHGRGSKPWYQYRYSEAELREWVPRLRELQEQTDCIYGYFNNHFSGNAPVNALQMLQLLQVSTPEQQDKLRRMLTGSAMSQSSLEDF